MCLAAQVNVHKPNTLAESNYSTGHPDIEATHAATLKPSDQ